MPISWILETYLYVLSSAQSLWLKQGQRGLCVSAYLSNIHSRVSSIRPFTACYLSKSSSNTSQVILRRTWCEWSRCKTLPFYKGSCLKYKCELHGSTSQQNTSSSDGSTGLSYRMSRIKNTLDSVSKAVSSTSSELIARIVRFKLNSNVIGKASDTNTHVVKHIKSEKCEPFGSRTTEVSENNLVTEHTIQTNDSSKLDANINPEKRPLENCTGGKETQVGLFHASYLTTNFGDTYNFLANHINLYFGGQTVMDQAKANKTVSDVSKNGASTKHALSETGRSSRTEEEQNSFAASVTSTTSIGSTESTSITPASTKKSIAHFLSHPTDRVQALMDSYLGGLVPKLKYEAKGTAEHQNKVQESEGTEKKDDQVNGKETKTAEDKAKRLSLQREKIIARVSVDNRTRALVQSLRRTSDIRICINKVEELSYHLLEFPESRGVAVKEKILPCLLRLRQASDETLQAAVSETLAMIGYVGPVKGRGVRVLTIDGGGTRGVVALQTLRRLEELTGKSVYELFDYICGVSTGSILAFMLGLFHLPLDECEELYRRLGADVFKQNVILGTVKMGWSHAFYDTEIWEKILKERMGSDLMIETARSPKCPKVAAVSTIVNRGTPLKAFVFRNYNHFPGVKSHYLGGCQYKLWQAIRASSAAPGYFQEYALGNDLHQDGGLLINNPCALALHECKCLWPNTPLQCVLSLGTGRYESTGKNNVTYTSLKAKLTNVISSATDTEEVHTMLDALLPPDTYFRFNPLMNEDIPLDENRKEKLNQLQMEGKRYLERNENKLKKAAKILTQEKTALQKLNDWIKLKADMYEGLPLFSKL